MQITRFWRRLGGAWAAASWAPVALAVGIGNPVLGGGAALLGQPLDFVLPLRLEVGEQLTVDCVGAEIFAGEQLIPAYELRVSLEPLNAELLRLRVQTLPGINEPALTVVVHVGCPPTRQTRRFVVLVDAALPATPLTGPAAALVTRPPAPETMPVALSQPAAAQRPGDKGSAIRAARGRPAETAATAAAVAQARDNRRANPSRVGAGAANANANVNANAAPRLQLDTLEPTAAGVAPAAAPVSVAAASRASAPANGANALSAVGSISQSLLAESVAVAASATERAMRSEQLLEQTRLELRASREQVTQLRERLALDQQAAGWAWPLLLLATLLAGVALWLGRRVLVLQGQPAAGLRPLPATGRQERGQGEDPGHAAWSPSQDPPDDSDRGRAERQTRSRLATAPLPFVPTALALGAVPSTAAAHSRAPTVAPPGPRTNGHRPGHAVHTTHAWPPPSQVQPWLPATPALSGLAPGSAIDSSFDAALPESPMAVTQPVAPGQRELRSGSRDVSIEELIDLEQQAEFFVVLGQDEAAIDLLVDHLRGTGGSSPLPYLKLLEIYHRRDDQLAYERTRARFNHRFNAWAPAWGADLAQGRGLDDYAGVLPRLVQVWPRPLDAMAELEALLFRKSRGDLFELPAYREVLFLYALARDLLDREAADSGNVDLLLPLADGTHFGSTAPLPFQLHVPSATGALGMATDASEDAAGHTFGDLPSSNSDDRPTAPVDFDLSAPAPPSSIFDNPNPRTVPPKLR